MIEVRRLTSSITAALAAVAMAMTMAMAAQAQDSAARQRSIVVASTTSTDNSGLFGYILPIFEAETGIKVHVVAVGTGQALEIARNGDADVLLVHHKPSEERFVSGGFGVDRRDLMYNDFVIIGPKADPAGIDGMTDVVEAFKKIAAGRVPFASRGDDSGTHKVERQIWRQAGIDASVASGAWYWETGSGMGATLNTAVGMDAYSLSDRATWLSFRNKGELVILVQGDRRLFNQYGVIRVNPARHPHVKAAAAKAFVDWLTSEAGQTAIADFKVDGRQLFFPNAKGLGP